MASSRWRVPFVAIVVSLCLISATCSVGELTDERPTVLRKQWLRGHFPAEALTRLGADVEAVSRRAFIGGGAAAVALTAGIGVPWWKQSEHDKGFPALGIPVSMAMHIHACYSEGPGSMEAQLTQAAESGVDVVWWTEHDQRMTAHGYRQAVHFDGMTEDEGGQGWTWAPGRVGPAAVRHDFVKEPVSPRDPKGSSSLLLSVKSDRGSYSEHRLVGIAENQFYRTCLDGQTIEVDVRPIEIAPTGFLAFDILTSYRPKKAGRPAGRYRLSYRIGPAGQPGLRREKGRQGVIWLDAPKGQWTTLRLSPADDMTALWPDLDGRDGNTFEVSVATAINGKGTVSAQFDALRFHRARNDVHKPLVTQSELMTRYARQFPTVQQIQALELSLITPHVGWYGGKVSLPDHGDEPKYATSDPAVAARWISKIHSAGGLASYNHPFGTSGDTLNEVQQEKARRLKVAEMVDNRALKCDLLEVGYRLRGGCDLARHESVWDSCSRNGIFLTGTGVSDDHKGMDWDNQLLNFVTWAWAASNSETDLLKALAGGRVYFGDPAMFKGRLDLLVDGRVRMGSIDVAPSGSRRRLSILASGLTPGSSIEVIRGEVDHAGPDQVDPLIVRSTLGESLFRGNVATVEIDTSTSCFIRTVARNATGVVSALSNPVWLLREQPTVRVPKSRFVT